MTKSTNRPRLHANFQDLMAHGKQMPNGCIEWQAGKGGFNYGQLRVNQSSKGVHRLALSLMSPPPKPGLVAMHSCDNPPCFNPDHLRWGTPRENALDRHAKGRTVYSGTRGQQIHTARLNESLVKEIRLLYAQGLKSPAIAEIYGIGSRQILLIVRRKSWKWVE